jgi:hypothetical protein
MISKIQLKDNSPFLLVIILIKKIQNIDYAN